jgi:hypothetical protein
MRLARVGVLIATAAVGGACYRSPARMETTSAMTALVVIDYEREGRALKEASLRNTAEVREHVRRNRNVQRWAGPITTFVGAVGAAVTGLTKEETAKWLGFAASTVTAGVGLWSTASRPDEQLVACATAIDAAIADWDNADRETALQKRMAYRAFRRAIQAQSAKCLEYGDLRGTLDRLPPAD